MALMETAGAIRLRTPQSWLWIVVVLAALAGTIAAVRAIPQGYSFLGFTSGYSQRVFASTDDLQNTSTSKGYLGGVVVLQNGDVIAAECRTNGTRLHRFDAVRLEGGDGSVSTPLHEEEIDSTPGGCGIALHPNGFVYSNMFEGVSGSGVVRIRLDSGDVGADDGSVKMGPAGNALGIAVDPQTNHLIYADAGCKPSLVPGRLTCRLIDLDPETGEWSVFASFSTLTIGYIDGIAFEPTGTYLFVTNRFPTWDLVVLDRSGAVVQQIPASSEPVGIGFHASAPKFVVTNNQDGTLLRFDFDNDDYVAPPIETTFASEGFRGDLMQAGPDGCLYLTQNGTRYNDGEQDSANSIVQICSGFAPPPGIVANPPAPSSLCGEVYHDQDNDGRQDDTEDGISGVAVILTGTDDLGRPVNAAVASGSEGGYCFNGLYSGSYAISELQPASYVDGHDTQGTPGTGTAEDDAFTGIVLQAGVAGAGNNFGELRPSSLSGFVYRDTDLNGSKSSEEAGIGGVTISLDGTDDRGAAFTASMTTGGDGSYAFTSLRPGVYTITETQPAGYLDGADTQGTPGTGATGNDVFRNVALAEDVEGKNNNFGEIPPATDLGIGISAPTSGTGGGTLTYTVTAVNQGPHSAETVVLKHAIPAYATVAAVSLPSGWACTAPAAGAAGTITCTKAAMAKNEAAIVTVTIAIVCPFPAAGVMSFGATVSSTTSDPNPANNIAAAATGVVNPAPVITGTMALSPSSWPPNHKMVNIPITYTVSSGCAGPAPVKLSVASNEPTNGSVDWQVVDANNVMVRSERAGNRNGRIYTVTVTATGPTGLTAAQNVQVVVPHDQGKGNRK